MNAIITILARSGSKGIPNKALTPVHGRTLLAWTLLHATQFGLYPILVSSDSHAILDHALAVNPDITAVHRPIRFATDTCPKMTAINWVAQRYAKYEELDAVIDLDICNPMRKWTDIQGALDVFTNHTTVDSVISATPARRHPGFNMVRYQSYIPEDYGYEVELIYPEGGYTKRQDTSFVWDLNSCIYIYRLDFLERSVHPVGLQTYIYPMQPHTFCDIDHPLDLSIVTHLMKEYGYV